MGKKVIRFVTVEKPLRTQSRIVEVNSTNKKLLVTNASLLVTSALLVVTKGIATSNKDLS